MDDQKTQEEQRKEFDAIEATKGTIVIKFTDKGGFSHVDLKGVQLSEALSALKEVEKSLFMEALLRG